MTLAAGVVLRNHVVMVSDGLALKETGVLSNQVEKKDDFFKLVTHDQTGIIVGFAGSGDVSFKFQIPQMTGRFDSSEFRLLAQDFAASAAEHNAKNKDRPTVFLIGHHGSAGAKLYSIATDGSLKRLSSFGAIGSGAPAALKWLKINYRSGWHLTAAVKRMVDLCHHCSSVPTVNFVPTIAVSHHNRALNLLNYSKAQLKEFKKHIRYSLAQEISIRLGK